MPDINKPIRRDPNKKPKFSPIVYEPTQKIPKPPPPKPGAIGKRTTESVMEQIASILMDRIEERRSPAWQRSEGKNPEGGLNKKGVMSYRRANPGSKLQTAVTTKPSKLKKGSKKAKRRLSFCRRMKGMKRKLTSAKTARDPNSRINKSLRKWNC